jgi:acetyl esterase
MPQGTISRMSTPHSRYTTIALLLLAFTPLTFADAPATQPTHSFIYKKIDKVGLEMIVHYPPGWQATDKRPAIVFFFGGGWTNGTLASFQTQCDYLAGRGMVAARADYRVKSRQGVTPKECVEDAKSAVRWMRQNAAKLGIDPDRLAAGGGSAGGHIAACTTLTPGLDADGEDTSISCKANALVLYNPVLFFGPQLAQRLNNDQALAKALSPTLHLEKDSPPTLLLYGTNDFLLTQGNDFMKRSKELGQRSELYLAEGQQHGFFNKSPWREKTTQRMAEFLESVGYLTRVEK